VMQKGFSVLRCLGIFHLFQFRSSLFPCLSLPIMMPVSVPGLVLQFIFYFSLKNRFSPFGESVIWC